ncbi:MAG: hypothetical protein WA705_17505 [Candidatus Ozemobacteraceae bacterium]
MNLFETHIGFSSHASYRVWMLENPASSSPSTIAGKESAPLTISREANRGSSENPGHSS